MKNKLRKITIDSQEYKWLAGEFNCDGDGGVRVKIFKDKKCIYDSVSHLVVTPQTIKELINAKSL
jgi:hypothetical protein